ncbi:MAG: hypothetical protein A2284_19465 [Deltaproteobacteria bacterium RIFOXYA12_FULL_61_11]|nr:MAG: hypothetical protein A2284_19465 [Deltaproteobacteria bacterium RIFOXYA12_FULL_61_11]
MKKALITGASEGIGRALTKALCKEGYAICAVARNEQRLKGLLQEMDGNSHSYLLADLGTQEGQQTVLRELGAEHYHLLVNNAGFGHYEAFTDTNLALFDNLLAVNCHAVLTLSHHFLRTSQSGDALINVSSVLGYLPMPKMAVYAASKAFVTSLSEALWEEQRGRGVYVMNLCPGVTETRFQERSGMGGHFKPPRLVVQSPEHVAQRAVAELRRRGKPSVVSGVLNSFFLFCTRWISREALLRAMGLYR